jgi:hypothetical protein
MRKSVRSENKKNTYILLSIRIVMQFYILFRSIYLLIDEGSDSSGKKDFEHKFFYGFITVISASKLVYILTNN